MKTQNIVPIIILFPWIVLSSCNKKAVIPTYIFIDSFDLSTDYIDQGSSSHGISDVWVYLDNEGLGVFELPAKIPVIGGGNEQLTLFPGIKRDGISNTRTPYPYYTAFNLSFSKDPQTVDTIHPSINYTNEATFSMLEDFESGNEFSGMNVTSVNNLVFEGNKSGVNQLDIANTSFAATSSPIVLPQIGNRIFLEMNYKNDAPFNVTVKANKPGNTSLEYVLTLNPKTEWNKIYIDITGAVSGNPADNYNIILDGDLPFGWTSATYYWDNIKIVHF